MPDSGVPQRRPPEPILRRFLAGSGFSDAGGVMTDLDGTALHETDGQARIPAEVAAGLAAVRARGTPIILNTLRFPANVMRGFGHEWLAIQGGPVPLVSLNGGIGGHIVKTASGALGFDEVFAQPLSPAEIDAVLATLQSEIAMGAADPMLFFHPRDWRQGETLWTPDAGRIPALRQRFPHADRVISSGTDALREALLGQDICLALLPQPGQSIWRQQRRRDFFTGGGADKLSGARRMAGALGIDLAASIGAGDTAMDVFLNGTGLAIRVGAPGIPCAGLVETLDVADAAGFGLAMSALAELLEAG